MSLPPLPPLLRAALFLVTQYLFDRTSTPPTHAGASTAPRDRAGDALHSGRGFHILNNVILAGLRLLMRCNTLLEAGLALLSLAYPTAGTSAAPTATATARILTAALLIAVSCAVRLHCYAQLGPLFTFVVAIRPQHRIVKTGVYGYVRHASYPAAWAGGAGAVLLHTAPGNQIVRWVPEWVLLTVLLAVGVVPPLLMVIRIRSEERVLEAEFGDEWRRYRKETWGVLPGVW
ncbi:hypothetical protein EDC01DRAFT_659421 [Geopyxis carbonaria]|nr:hypothetical protein EDC01DRAFT_659421 [Geopyxis carbonaria]